MRLSALCWPLLVPLLPWLLLRDPTALDDDSETGAWHHSGNAE
jgi:hypothetical protein